MVDFQEDNSDISKDCFVCCYVNGLHDGIKCQLRPLCVDAPNKVFTESKDTEPSHASNKISNNGVSSYEKFTICINH